MDIIISNSTGEPIYEQIAAQINGTPVPQARASAEDISIPEGDAMADAQRTNQSGIVEKARQRAEQAGQPE